MIARTNTSLTMELVVHLMEKIEHLKTSSSRGSNTLYYVKELLLFFFMCYVAVVYVSYQVLT